MAEPTITFEGVEIPDFGERQFPYAVIEVTRRCNLRCKT
jgi:MoaA/NifB/PqqE/SkfB family radical SAM enzyme